MHPLTRTTPLLLLLLLAACAERNAFDYRAWATYHGDAAATHYSALNQINRENVQQLEVAWVHNTGDRRDDRRGTIECNPIIVNGMMYVTSPALKVLALDAATGERIWTYDPYTDSQARGVNRGVTYWADGDDRRILFTAGWTPYLYALDADTGEPIRSFGEDGRVNFGAGFDDHGAITATTPGAIYKDLYILGTRVGEGPKPAGPGHVSAYDVRTGERVWTFYTIPRPGEYGHETWGSGGVSQTMGGANAWAGVTVDAARGMVFLPLTTPAYGFYGGDRPGDNLFSSSVVALDADTGERIWHYQITHHDLWDYEPASQPNLVTVTHDGRRIDAVAQVSKRGDVFLLDRETGEPLFPVEERPVPQSDLPGEVTSPTQPFPVKPPAYVRQGITEADLTNISEEAHAYALEQFRKLRTGSMFIPPSREGSLFSPGLRGGTTWGGAGFDPETGVLYVNASEVPGIIAMAEVEPEPGASLGAATYRAFCASCHGLDRAGDPPAYPSLVHIGDTLSKDQVRQIINTGQGMMPPFGRMSEEKKDAILAYLFNEEAEIQEGTQEIDVDQVASSYPYVHTGWKTFVDQEGYPAVKPPWGTLNAIDLNEGEILWQATLGEHPELIARGLPPTGTDNLGGPLITAGGLVFIGATKDEKFRAFDKATGEILWEAQLPAGGYATPATYEIAGRQYVVIAAGGGGLMGTPASDAFVAFALPEE